MKFTYSPESRPLDGYTIKRGIERGGFGEVYYALSDGGKEVALKLLQQNMDVELRGVSQCLNLKHPNLVTIFDIRRDDDGDHWIVMEYVRGKGLDRVIAEHPGGMPVDEVARWLSGIAAGLGFLHDRGIVHRDLKPANVYHEDDTVKIGDVGLSKFISESRRNAQTQSVGTVYYMAPEVAHGRYGHEVDVYALGVVLYELLTGRVPFDGESTAEILMKHLSEKPDLSRLPRKLQPVIAAALEKDPLKRTPSVARLDEEFRRAARGIDPAIEIPPESFVKPHEARRDGLHAAHAHPGPGESGHYEHERARPNRQAQEVRLGPTRYESGRHERRRRAGYGVRHAGEAGHNWWQWVLLGVIALVVLQSRALGPVLWLAVVGGLSLALALGVAQIVRFLSQEEHGPQGFVRGRPGRAAPGGGPPHADGAAAGVIPQAIENVTAPLKEAFGRRARVPSPSTPRTIGVRYRLADATTSMALAVLCTALITGGLWLAVPVLHEPARAFVFGSVTLLGAWAVILVSKLLWEGRPVESGHKRFVLLFVGAALGGVAWWMTDTLLITSEHNFVGHDMDGGAWGRVGLFESLGRHDLIGRDRQPTLLGFVVFFAGLLALRRWWRHCDAFRKRRFRISSLLLTVGVGFLVASVWSFPWLWSLTWAAAISSVVQIASGWVPPDERYLLMEVRADV